MPSRIKITANMNLPPVAGWRQKSAYGQWPVVSTLGLGPMAIVTRCNVLASNPSLSH